MSLYTPRHFLGSDAAAQRLIRENPFATVITSVDGRDPHVTHVPVLLEDGALSFHLARANPHGQAFAQGHTLVVFHGPHAYISPRWYVEPDANVPTWNYATVHVHGRPEILEAGAPDALLRLTDHFERGAWRPTAEKLAKLAPGVVAFRMRPERLEVKVKMSQNRTRADRAKLVATLRASDRADDRALADWIDVDGSD